jgi:AbrB family looped-hinge helix DNA binding protein
MSYINIEKHKEKVMETIATTKGQIVIPSKVRSRLGIKEGTRIQIEVNERDQSLTLTPITRQYIHSIRGKHKGTGLLKALMAEKKKEREL